MKNNKYSVKIKEAIEKVAKTLNKQPHEVTKKDLVGEVSDWTYKMAGGLDLVKRAYFPVQADALSEIAGMKNASSYISKLETKLGKQEALEQFMFETLLKNIPAIKVPKAKKLKKHGGIAREVVVSLNDTHFGAIVNPDEVNHSNKFNWEVACRRTAFLAQQVAEYKIEKRNEVTKLHVILNGDLLQGVIHDLTARTAELLGLQQAGAIHILIHFIAHVSQFYDKVEVHGVAGNHDDYPHRREGGRVTSHKYDSALAPVFAAVSAAFRNEKRIKFNFPKGLHIDIQLPGGRLLVTHGDTLFSKQLGNPSSSLNVKGLSDAINRFNTGEINKGKALVKMVLFGHVHNHVNFTSFDGVKVYVAPSLSGIDSYAHSLGINTNQIGQVIFESSKKHILGDPRLVDMLEADNNPEMDKIIPVYKNELVIE